MGASSSSTCQGECGVANNDTSNNEKGCDNTASDDNNDDAGATTTTEAVAAAAAAAAAEWTSSILLSSSFDDEKKVAATAVGGGTTTTVSSNGISSSSSPLLHHNRRSDTTGHNHHRNFHSGLPTTKKPEGDDSGLSGHPKQNDDDDDDNDSLLGSPTDDEDDNDNHESTADMSLTAVCASSTTANHQQQQHLQQQTGSRASFSLEKKLENGKEQVKAAKWDNSASSYKSASKGSRMIHPSSTGGNNKDDRLFKADPDDDFKPPAVKKRRVDDGRAMTAAAPVAANSTLQQHPGSKLGCSAEHPIILDDDSVAGSSSSSIADDTDKEPSVSILPPSNALMKSCNGGVDDHGDEDRSSGYWDGNGISRQRVRKFVNVLRKRCHKCARCKTPCCGICVLCRYGNFIPKHCVFQCCVANGDDVRDLYRAEIEHMGKRKERPFHAGDRVYAFWPPTKMWYWGTIKTIYNQKQFKCTVIFEDGDSRYGVLKKDLISEFDYRLSKYELPPAKEEEVENAILLSYLASVPCGACVNCSKAACGRCAACRGDKGILDSENRYCLQKTCVKCDIKTIERGAPGLPEGWTFYFVDPSRDNDQFDQTGLRVKTTGGRCYRYQSFRVYGMSTQAQKDVDMEKFYNYVGLDIPSADQPVQVRNRKGKTQARIYSKEKVVGARCYALYSDGEYYWGNIRAVHDNGGILSFDIVYEDGDALAGVYEEDIYTEQYYFDTNNEAPPEPARATASSNGNALTQLSLKALFRLRCGSCSMCRKQDCGLCHSCVSNRDTTAPTREVCLLKMCFKIDIEQKARPLPGCFGTGCQPTYYFTEHDGQAHESELVDFHENVFGLRILYKRGSVLIEGRCLKEVLTALGMGEDIDYLLHLFFENKLGLKLQRRVRYHELVGKECLRQWIDANGKTVSLYGKITGCCRSLLSSGHETFRIEYNEDKRTMYNLGVDGGRRHSIPSVEYNVSAEIVWGSYLAANASLKVPPSRLFVPPVDHLKWLVPSEIIRMQIPGQVQPRIVMYFEGFKLVFEAQRSTIAGAGLGLFVKCETDSTQLDFFELEAGHLLDLGVYAPLTDEDKISEKLNHVKNFLYNYSGESWAFGLGEEQATCHDEVYDITCNFTGKLKEPARRNSLIYVNETDGKKQATVDALYDPEGSVHYMLGHRSESDGPLKLPLGIPVELKIDYGEVYEKVRVRKGYSRLQEGSEEMKTMRKSIAHADSECLKAIAHFSAGDVYEALSFLENVAQSKEWQTPESSLICRALLAVLELRQRVDSIGCMLDGVDLSDPDSFCDNGALAMMKDTDIEDRTVHLTKSLGEKIGDPHAFKETVLATNLFTSRISKAIGCTSDELKSLEPLALKEKIVELT